MRGPQHVVVVAGGSLLAWHGLRESTRDVDSLRRLDPELVSAADEVGAAHGLAAGWLNAHAAGFAPATLDLDACGVLLERPRLRVLGAPLEQVFLMKLYSARDRDLDDLRALWPHTGFASAEDAVEQFWQAYPHAPDDPSLSTSSATSRGPTHAPRMGPWTTCAMARPADAPRAGAAVPGAPLASVMGAGATGHRLVTNPCTRVLQTARYGIS